jgi:hypothetical protein
LLADLAEATGGVTLETIGQVENLVPLIPEQIRTSWEKDQTKKTGKAGSRGSVSLARYSQESGKLQRQVKDRRWGNCWIVGFKDIQATTRNTLDVDHCRCWYWTGTMFVVGKRDMEADAVSVRPKGTAYDFTHSSLHFTFRVIPCVA